MGQFGALCPCLRGVLQICTLLPYVPCCCRLQKESVPVLCPHCHSHHVIKGSKTKAGQQHSAHSYPEVVMTHTRAVFMFAAMILLTPALAAAQNALPRPDPAFQGKIEQTYKDSTPNYPQPVQAAKGSPNVLIILLDDVDFGMAGTFGGPVPTPNLDKLAANGLKYNRFHTTALCSPSRAGCWRGATTTASARA